MQPEVDPINSWGSLQQMSEGTLYRGGRLLGRTLLIASSYVRFWLGILRGFRRTGCPRFDARRERSPKSLGGQLRHVESSVTENGIHKIHQWLGTVSWLDQGNGQTAGEIGGAKSPDVILRRRACLGGGKKGRERGNAYGYNWIPGPRPRNHRTYWRKWTELNRHDLETVIVGLKREYVVDARIVF